MAGIIPNSVLMIPFPVLKIKFELFEKHFVKKKFFDWRTGRGGKIIPFFVWMTSFSILVKWRNIL